MFAHSLPGRDRTEWEPLTDHLMAIGNTAAKFAAIFGWADTGRAAGLLHDIGKCSDNFQAYIGAAHDVSRRGPDHSTAGARAAVQFYGKPLGRMLAYAIAGHHAGLADSDDLDRRLHPDYEIKPIGDWEKYSGVLPSKSVTLPPMHFDFSGDQGFSSSFLVRMLFSCLVDADFLETEGFHARARGEPDGRGGFSAVLDLRDRLRRYMAGKREAAIPSAVNALRNRVLDHAIGKAALAPGLFTLTVPTGGGKTLASLSFALEHAVKKGMQRVIYVIPYTSIIEQTALVFRDALKTGNDDVLEHHASFDWDKASRDDHEGRGGIDKLRKAAENWDAPIVVTTAVQFFESLFANRTSRCRKLHNLAGAVIVLDEAQTLPLNVLRPCMAALQELCRNYRASVVLCTATQSALRVKDGFLGGFAIGDDRELAPEPAALYTGLRRVTVETNPEPVPDFSIAARFAEQPRMLCIVNSLAHARSLFELLRDLPGATHLTTLMCPRHRRAVLADVRSRLDLKSRQPVRLVSTSLIEAGVDVDFPEVWRAAAGLDSIAQAAGRCNREGRLETGRTVVFEPVDAKPPRALDLFWQAARPVLRRGYGDILGLDAMKAYFRELYRQKGPDALDTVRVDGRPGVLKAINEGAGDWNFPFRSIADAFRLIEDIRMPVVVPWRADEADDDACRLLDRIAAMDRPRSADLRALQQYTVTIPREARNLWLAAGVLRPVHDALGDDLLKFENLAHYRPDTGVDIRDIGLRAAELNIL